MKVSGQTVTASKRRLHQIYRICLLVYLNLIKEIMHSILK
jgi:hypothetical protein